MSKNNKASNYNEKMLTRLRIQFIVLSMAVVIIMQGFIVYTSVRNTYSKMVSKSDHLVSSIYINVLDKKPVKADARYFYIIFDKNNNPKTINVDNISDISEDEALAIYYEAYETGELDGFYNGYRYCIYEKEKRSIAIFVLRSNMIDDVKKTALSLIEGSCVGIGIMLLVLIFASKLIVMPIAKAHRKQKEFITSASHELKTPITVIRADADILLMDDENNKWLADIKKQAENLTTMTNNLVTLARMDERNGNIPRIDFPVSELAEEVVHSYNALAIDFGKHFSYDIKPNLSCCGDAAAYITVFLMRSFHPPRQAYRKRTPASLFTFYRYLCAYYVYNSAHQRQPQSVSLRSMRAVSLIKLLKYTAPHFFIHSAARIPNAYVYFIAFFF